MMNEQHEKLQICLLGGCSLTYKGKTIDEKSIRSKKFWILLEYLIVFRNKNISQAELLELIYPEGKSENPSNALKTQMHRIRNVLEQLEYMDSRDMIIQTRGAYSWNPNMDCSIDAEDFEALCNKGSSPWASESEQLQSCLSAVELYKGDFLHKTVAYPWAMQLNMYYRTLYSSTVHKAIELLDQNGEYIKMIQICQKALGIDAFDEFFYLHLIQGYIKTGKSQEALKEYKNMSNVFYKEFGVTPSKELRKLYREIIKSTQKVETDLSIIKKTLSEEAGVTGAYYCEYEIFRDFYRLEARAVNRTGETVFLCLLTLSAEDGQQPALKILGGNMDRLKQCIQKTLRKGDIFAQYSPSQFIMLLPFTTFENGATALQRIVRQFRRQNPYNVLSLAYSLQPLEPTETL